MSFMKTVEEGQVRDGYLPSRLDWKARAEKAEKELARIRSLQNTRSSDKGHHFPSLSDENYAEQNQEALAHE